MAENKLVKLTSDDLAELYQYSRKMDELAAQEPEDHAGDDWKAWDAQRAALIDEYGDVYGKFLWSTHEEWKEDPTKAADVLKYYLANSGNFDLQMFADDPEISAAAIAVRDAGKNLLTQPYVLMLNSDIFNALFTLSLSQFREDPHAHVATYKKDGWEVKVYNYEDVKNITSSQLLLWDAGMMYLTFFNYKQTENPRTTVEIPLAEYAAIRGRDISAKDDTTAAKNSASSRKYNFKKDIEADLDVLQRIKYTFSIHTGPTAGNYKDLPLILNNPEITGPSGREVIKISFDEDMARILLSNNQYMRYAIKLQGLNSSNPNNVPVGRYMNLHASMYGNQRRGTDLTLTVKSLLSSAPNIPKKETLDARGQRKESAWHDKIKKPLEIALDNLVKGKVLKQWEYRHARTGHTLTPDEIVDIELSWNEYENLRVDYSLAEDMPPRQEIEETIRGILGVSR